MNVGLVSGSSSIIYSTSTSALLPLRDMKFVLSGKMDKEKYQGKIEALGGKVTNSVHRDTIALISDKGRTDAIIT